MTLNQTLITLLIVGNLIALSACSDDKKGRGKGRAKIVEVTVVDRQPVKLSRIITGSLETIQSVQIRNEEPARIQQIHFYEGDTVKKDALLVELDGSLIEAELDKARASLNQAKLDLKRIKRLMPSNLASQDQLAIAKTTLAQTQAEARLLQTRLEHTKIRAPFTGKISVRLKEPGDVVPTHSHILTIINPYALKAKLHVSEILLSHLQKDATLSLRIDALGDTRFPARILRIHPTVDPITRQGVVEVLLEPVPEGALPGQLCRLYLATETMPLRTLPLAALRHDVQGEYVYRLDPQGKSRYTWVKTGLQINDRVEILEGVSMGDQIIVKGIIGLRDGSKVKVLTAGQPTKVKSQTNIPSDQKGP